MGIALWGLIMARDGVVDALAFWRGGLTFGWFVSLSRSV